MKITLVTMLVFFLSALVPTRAVGVVVAHTLFDGEQSGSLSGINRVITADTSTFPHSPQSFSMPQGPTYDVDFDASGNLYVLGNQSVYRVNTDGSNPTLLFNSPNFVNNTANLAVSPDGSHVAITLFDGEQSGSLSGINRVITANTSTFPPSPQSFSMPQGPTYDVDFDASGNLYVLGSQSVFRVNTDGSNPTLLFNSPNFVNNTANLAVSPDGSHVAITLFDGEQSGSLSGINRVITADTSTFPPSPQSFSMPQGPTYDVDFDANGDLYVLASQSVYRVNTDGSNPTLLYNSPNFVNNTANLAVFSPTAIPEVTAVVPFLLLMTTYMAIGPRYCAKAA